MIPNDPGTNPPPLTAPQLDAYLTRIGIDEPIAPDLDGLRRLHRAHLLNITWEAIDCFMGWPSSIAPAAFHSKIVGGRRGGWCYEMNGLFGAALEALGFRVYRLAGCVDRPKLGDAAIGNHLTLRVDLERPYLAEVGAADTLIEPVPMAIGAISQRGFDFRITPAENGWLRFQNHSLGIAQTIDFKPDHIDELALQQMHGWLTNDPASPFINALAVFRHFEDGYVSLQNDRLRRVTASAVHEQNVTGPDHLAEVLEDNFKLNVPQVAAIWDKVAHVRARAAA